MYYRGIRVFVKGEDLGSSNQILLLHGWGTSSAAMDGIYRYLLGLGRTVYAMDFPGFGNSDYPPESWGVYDYADCAQYVISQLRLSKPVIVGHSFGGRIAIILGSRAVAYKLVLTSAAGLKPKPSLRKFMAVRRYKAAVRRGKADKNAGSADYAAAPPQMKKVFVRIVNTHLNGLLGKIKVPTLIFWGKDDSETPLYMAKKLNRRIADSGLITVDGAGHFAYAQASGTFNAALRVFTE